MKLILSPSRRLPGLLALAAVLLATAIVFGSRIRQKFTIYLALRSAAPSAAALEELLTESSDPAGVVEQLWRDGGIPHRQLALLWLKDHPVQDTDLWPRLRSVVREAAFDVDLSAREIAFGIMEARRDPELLPFALAQLRDADGMIRMLGLEKLGRERRPALFPTFVRLLDDPELIVVTRAAAVLRKWTGEDFGVRISQAVVRTTPEAGGAGPTGPSLDDREAVAAGVQRWKEWWASAQRNFPTDQPNVPVTIPRPRPAVVSDFALTDLAGRAHRLSEFRGRVVLLNFWTTWCLACQKEMPDLIELHRRYPDRLVILGISLDGVPDEHGHAPDDAAPGSTAESASNHEHGDEHGSAALPLAKVREKVIRFAKRKELNYPVFLDPGNEIGAAFNGGELPTNVWLDRDGRVRRRFIGGRSLAVFEAMFQELEHAASPGEKPAPPMKERVRP